MNIEQFSFPRRAFGEKLRNSNLPKTVPIIGLGCSSFANNFVSSQNSVDAALSFNQKTAHLLPVDNKQVKEWIETVKYAIEKGVNLLDTAPWYGHGTSEVTIGLALRQSYFDRAEIIINTKVGRFNSDAKDQFDFSYDETIHSVERSIERMGCGYIDVLQLHDPEFSPSIDLLLEETIPAMLECKRRGLVKALGLTGYPLVTHYQILERVREISNNDEAVFDQTLTYGHFNLHDQSIITSPVDEEKKESFVQYCQSRSIAIMAAAPLSMGLLTHNPPPFWHPASIALKEACKNASEIARENEVNLPTLAILFALTHDCIGCTLLGLGRKRDVDCMLDAVKRYAGSAHQNNIPTSGFSDNGKELRRRIESNLSSILSEVELKVLRILLDESKGPFAEIWKSEDYAWDGVEEANKFWSKVEGGKTEGERRMRKQQQS